MRRPALAARPGRLDAILGLPPQSQQPLESQRHSVQVAARSRDRLPDLPPDSEPSAYCLNSQAYGADTQRSFVSSCSQGPQSQSQLWGESQSQNHLLPLPPQAASRGRRQSVPPVSDSQDSASTTTARSFEATLAAKSHDEVMRSLTALQTAHKDAVKLIQSSDTQMSNALRATRERTEQLVSSMARHFDDKLAALTQQLPQLVADGVEAALRSEREHTALLSPEQPRSLQSVPRRAATATTAAAPLQSCEADSMQRFVQHSAADDGSDPQQHVYDEDEGSSYSAQRRCSSSAAAVAQKHTPVRQKQQQPQAVVSDEVQDDVSVEEYLRRRKATATAAATAAAASATAATPVKASANSKSSSSSAKRRRVSSETQQQQQHQQQQCAYYDEQQQQQYEDSAADSLFCSLGARQAIYRN
eukprot:19309-Heterococcus_DN1.PRE.1